MKTTLYTHDSCALHEISPGHPECPGRIAAVTDALKEAQLYDLMTVEEAPEADLEVLARAHGNEYVDDIVASAPATGRVQLDADTAMNPHSLEAGLRAAGAGIVATEAVANAGSSAAFCVVRPPGHHAEKTRAMGFCLFGSIAVAALHALDHLGLDRVAIVDFDVHHGNGTEDIIHGDKRVLFCSSFQHPYYPGYFRPSEDGHIVNVPLAAGTDGSAFRDAITAQWLPALEAFAPQMLFISAGFDAHAQDPLAALELNESDFQWVTEQLVEVADRHCDGRIVSMLEGGYSLTALGRSAAAHVDVLLRA